MFNVEQDSLNRLQHSMTTSNAGRFTPGLISDLEKMISILRNSSSFPNEAKTLINRLAENVGKLASPRTAARCGGANQVKASVIKDIQSLKKML